MGLDVSIIMCRNYKQLKDPNFWNWCSSGWVEDDNGVVDYTKPAEVYYARKFWDLYTPTARMLGIGNDEYSRPLTKDDLEWILDCATHTRDYFGTFSTVTQLCEIIDRYDKATSAGMIFVFSGNY